MKTLIALLTLTLVLNASVFAQCCGGCKSKGKGKAKGKVVQQTEVSEEKVCKKCGEEKGTANCCKKDAKKCSKCNLNKGSVGCKKACKKAKCDAKKAKCGAKKSCGAKGKSCGAK